MPEQQNSDEHEQVKVALEEYKILWEYYRFIMDLRAKIFDWHLKAVLLPSSVVGLSIAAIKSEKVNIEISIAMHIAGLLLIAVFLLGLCLFLYYCFETANSYKYTNSTTAIRKFIREKYSNLDSVLILDCHRLETFPEAVPFFRGLAFGVINSVVLSGAILLLTSLDMLCCITIIFFVTIIFHASLFLLIAKTDKYDVKQKN